MTNTIAISRLPIRRALGQLASKYAFYYDTIIGFAFPALLTNLVNDAVPNGNGVSDWFVVSLSGYVAAAAVLLIARRLFFGMKKISAAVPLSAFAFAGAARGLAIYYLGGSYGLLKPSDFGYRVFGSTLFSFFMLSLITVLVSNAVRSRRKLDELEHQRFRLQDALVNLRENLAVQKAELAGRVKALVNPMIEELLSEVASSRISGSVTDAVESLKNTVDSEIRPLSMQIGADQGSSLFADSSKPKPQFRLFTRLQSRILVSSLYSPLWFTLLLVMVASPAASHIFGAPYWGYQVIIVGLISLALFQLAKRTTVRMVVTQERAFLVQLASYAIIGFAIDLALTFSPFNTVHYTPGRVTLYYLVAGCGFFIGQLFQLQRESAAVSLATTNENLERLNSEARRELWVYRRRVATVLHGPVQARLYASAIRLAQAKRVTSSLVDRVSTDLQSVLAELDFDKPDRVSLRLVIRQIIDVWSGTCEIYPKIDKAVFLAAKRDANFETAFIEIVREAISNAVKHSKATEIELQAESAGSIVTLRLINNGKVPVEPNKIGSGFGSSLVEELTLRSALNQADDGRTTFEAEFVVA